MQENAVRDAISRSEICTEIMREAKPAEDQPSDSGERSDHSMYTDQDCSGLSGYKLIQEATWSFLTRHDIRGVRLRLRKVLE